MANPMVKFVNAETGEEIEREMTTAEFQQYEAEQAAYQAKLADEQSKDAAKQALLTKLGITADEAALLLA
jgi:hypothetical protein